MRDFRRIRGLALPLAATVLATSMVPPAQAAIISTDQVIQHEASARDRMVVADFMQRDDVRQQLEKWGVDPDEAAARTGNLSESEIRLLAGDINALPAGQSAVGAIVGAAVLIFIVLLITDIAGLTDVFPFTRSVTKR